MHIVIVGCGRVGAELARSASQKGHEVEVIDPSPRAFERLGREFHGRALHGSGIDRQVLERASIERADAFAAVTSSDSTNFVASRIAIDIYRVPNVVARAYNPHRLAVYERFGIQTVASSSWGAQRMEEMITSPRHASRLSIGNGDVEVVETRVPAQWAGRRVGELDLAQAKVVALTRGGRARLAGPELVLEEGDLLYLAVAADELPRVAAMFSSGRS